MIDRYSRYFETERRMSMPLHSLTEALGALQPGKFEDPNDSITQRLVYSGATLPETLSSVLFQTLNLNVPPSNTDITLATIKSGKTILQVSCALPQEEEIPVDTFAHISSLQRPLIMQALAEECFSNTVIYYDGNHVTKLR